MFPHRGVSSSQGLDALLDEVIRLDCIGGFAVVMGYGLARATNDLDYRTLHRFQSRTGFATARWPAVGARSKIRSLHAIHGCRFDAGEL